MTKHLKEAIDDRTITINHHDYLLSGYNESSYYKVDIIPDYYIFEDGMACDCTVDCYDYGDKASSPYTNMIGVHYKVWITPSGKTKAKLVLDETELIDKDDFDYLNDSVFVMICEWIDNHYGKELFESKKSARKSLKESNEGYYIYTEHSDGHKYVYCDAVLDPKPNWYLLEDYMIKAIHVFKTEKEARKFIDENAKKFMMDKNDITIAEYPKNNREFFESKKSARKSLKESNETNLIDSVATKLKDEKIINAKIDTYKGADWIYIIKDDYKIEIFYRRKELAILLYNIKDYNEDLVDSELEIAYSLSDDDFSVNYVIDFIKNFIKEHKYLKSVFSIKESMKESRKIGYIRKTEYEINGNNYPISDNGKLFKIIDDLDSKGFTFKYESEWISKDICKHFLADDDEAKVDLYK